MKMVLAPVVALLVVLSLVASASAQERYEDPTLPEEEIWGAPLLFVLVIGVAFGIFAVACCVAGYREHKDEIDRKIGRICRAIWLYIWVYPVSTAIAGAERLNHWRQRHQSSRH